MLYHGSKVGGIKEFEPKIHYISPEKPIVFATDNRNYALAMVHGTGDDLAVCFVDDEMYIDELKEGALKLLNSSGYLYEVDEKFFQQSPEGLPSEYISYKKVPALSEIKIENIREELEKDKKVYLVEYKDVLKSIEERGQAVVGEKIKHGNNRFKK